MERLVAALRAAPWVKDVATDTGGVIRLTVTDDEAAAAGALPLVVDAGVRLSTFERVRPSLEDVFIELVGPRRADELDGRGFVRAREVGD